MRHWEHVVEPIDLTEDPEDGELRGHTTETRPGAMRAALLSRTGFVISLHAILIGVSLNVSATQSAWRPSSSRRTSKLLESGCSQATRTSDPQYWDQPM